MDKISQKPEQNQELYKFLCSSEQGTNPGTVGTLWATGEEAQELEHPHSSPRKGHGVSACGGGKYSIKPLEAAAAAQAVSHTVPLAWQSIGHGLLQLLPALARHPQPVPAPVAPTFPCHLSAVTSSRHRVLRRRGHCPARPHPTQSPAGVKPHREFQRERAAAAQLSPASLDFKAALVWRATESFPSQIQPVGRAPAVPGKQ